jgi:hypothetical protein
MMRYWVGEQPVAVDVSVTGVPTAAMVKFSAEGPGIGDVVVLTPLHEGEASTT